MGHPKIMMNLDEYSQFSILFANSTYAPLKNKLS